MVLDLVNHAFKTAWMQSMKLNGLPFDQQAFDRAWSEYESWMEFSAPASANQIAIARGERARRNAKQPAAAALTTDPARLPPDDLPPTVRVVIGAMSGVIWTAIGPLELLGGLSADDRDFRT